MTLPLGEPDSYDCESAGIFGLGHAQQHRGEQDPFRGWHSMTYGEWTPSTWLRTERNAPVSAVWGVGKKPEIREVELLTVAGTALALEWGNDSVTLTVTPPDGFVRHLCAGRAVVPVALASDDAPRTLK
jgi:hypothetical protein